MNSTCKPIFATLFLFIASHTLFAQLQTSKTEIGINVGSLIYQGDLSRSFIGNYKSLHPVLGLYVSKALDPYFSLRGNLTLGKISEDELNYSSPAWKRDRAFNFSSSITELSAMLVFNPFGDNSRSRITPYVFGGGGVTFLHVKRDWSKYNRVVYNSKSQIQVGLGKDTLHSPPKAIAVLPLGAGLRYALNQQWSLTVEGTYRFTASDYLDGFKYSGNPARRDSYYGVSIGVSYKFGGYKCPPVGR